VARATKKNRIVFMAESLFKECARSDQSWEG